MKVLLTGASSFLGQHLARRFSAAGLSVVGTYRSPGGAEGLAGLPGLKLVRIDISDAAAMAALPAPIDAIVHVAGVSVAPGVTNEEMIACNVVGSQNVLDYARRAGAKRLIYASSLSIHGMIVGGTVDETTPLKNPGVYGATKYVGERLFAEESDRLPCAAIRLPGVLGQGAHRAWIPTLCERAKAGRDLIVYNPDASFNNAVHVDDMAAFFLGLLKRDFSGFHAFPVGASGMITVREVCERIIAATKSSSRLEVIPAPEGSFSVSSAYARTVLGYKPSDIGVILDRYLSGLSA